LLVGVTLFALWCGYYLSPVVKEWRAEAVLRRYGAKVTYWENAPRSWLDHLYDRRLIRGVEIVSKMEPEVVEAFESLVNPREIALFAPVPPQQPTTWQPGIPPPPPHIAAPNGAIGRILSGRSLRSLTIGHFSLIEADFKAISEHHALQSLRIERVNVSEEALAQLIVLPQLERFKCHFCRVTGVLLDEAEGSVTLQEVDCMGSPMGVELAEYIARCPNVRVIQLQFFTNSGADEFLAPLEHHPSLSSLLLGGPGPVGITDRSIPVLETMPGLKNIGPVDRITKEGRARLLQSRPDLSL
jgi:hypothetical protein